MNFLAKLFSYIAVPLLNWIVDKISASYSEWKAKKDDEKRIKEVNQAVKEKLKAAKTKEEKDEAVRDLINRL